MKALGSVKRIQLADEDALAAVIGKAAARRVIAHYRGLKSEAAGAGLEEEGASVNPS